MNLDTVTTTEVPNPLSLHERLEGTHKGLDEILAMLLEISESIGIQTEPKEEGGRVESNVIDRLFNLSLMIDIQVSLVAKSVMVIQRKLEEL